MWLQLWKLTIIAVKQKGQRTKAFLRVLKYSNGGILEVILSFYTVYLDIRL